MSDQTGADPEGGAPMDYEEHEKTFNLFMALTKWGTVVTAAVLIAMAFGFFAGGGFFGGLVVFILALIVAWFVL